MGFEKVEFTFPDEEETSTEIEIGSSATSPFEEAVEEAVDETEDDGLDIEEDEGVEEDRDRSG